MKFSLPSLLCILFAFGCTSGHSVISAACGTVFTHLMGDNVAFTDTTGKNMVKGLSPSSHLRKLTGTPPSAEFMAV
jgi:hypothetical protein